MVHHIVMWKFKPEIEEERKADLKKDMEANLSSLIGKVSFVSEPFASSTHDMALVTTFEKAEDIKAYSAHPEHVKVADTYVRPFVTERACLDYQD